MKPTSLEFPYQKNTNIQSIQIMRGIAAILVVLLHISIKGDQYGNGALKGFTTGGSGVDLFFIISGFIMCVSTIDRSLNFYQFMLLRIKRIIPLYWLTSIAALAIFFYNPKIINTSGGETSIWASFTLIPTGKRYLNSNGWTLSYEFFFYILFGIFLNKGTYKAMLWSSVVLLLLVVCGLVFNSNTRVFLFSTDNLYIEFVFGMGCFYLLQKKKVKLNPTYSIALCLLGLLLLALEFILQVPGQEKGRGVLWGIPMLCIFTGALSLEDLIQRSTSRIKNLFLEIGNSSYSLYLIHPFTLSGTAMCLRYLKMASNPYVFTVVLLVVSVAIGHLVYLFIEKPLISLMKRDTPVEVRSVSVTR